MRQLSATQPEAIAISPEVSRAGNGIELSGFPPLQTLIDDGYTRLEDVARDSKYGGWQLYVRR